MKEIVKIRGKYKKKNGVPIIETQFFQNPQIYEVPIEELFEDLEDKGVYIRIEEAPFGKPIYQEEKWEMPSIKEVDPDYKHCSEKGREKFLDMKFGMMVHWGIYSVLGIPESWPANATRCDPAFLDVYYTLWQVFNPTEFNADEWAELAIKAGMQFFQLTSKHHDGFCMYNTKTKTWARKRFVLDHGPGVGRVDDVFINFSIMDTMFKRDILGEVIEAFRKRGLGIGFYFSHIDWNDPNFRWDPANRSFDPNYSPENNPEEWKQFIEREKEQLRELCSNYGAIDQIFFDGSWHGLEFDKLVEIIKMCRELQPDCMFSNRGIGAYGDFTSPERWIPENQDDKRLYGMLWQVCDPIHTSWAYLPNDKYKPLNVLLHNLVDAIAKGGTYVFAIAPMSNGKFPPKTVEYLEFFGKWLKKYGEAIYSTRPWKKYKEKDKEIYFTRSKDNKNVYLISFEDFSKPIIVKDLAPQKDSEVILLGLNAKVHWKINKDNDLEIEIPKNILDEIKDEIAVAFKIYI
ncbi:MAG: alpha-L-fucosidase [Promethearchaeota archaeon]